MSSNDGAKFASSDDAVSGSGTFSNGSLSSIVASSGRCCNKTASSSDGAESASSNDAAFRSGERSNGYAYSIPAFSGRDGTKSAPSDDAASRSGAPCNGFASTPSGRDRIGHTTKTVAQGRRNDTGSRSGSGSSIAAKG